jgi:hypothetical protein
LPEGVEENLQALVSDVLDPARKAYGKPISVNSGYRCPKHNLKVGGAVGSQHMRGEAADVRPVQGSQDSQARMSDKVEAGFTVQDLARVIVANGRWDQMILYPTFVHVSWKRNGANRHQVLRKTASGYQRVEARSI